MIKYAFILFCFFCTSVKSQTSWENAGILYSENGVKVELEYKLRPDSCETNSKKRSRYQYILSGNLSGVDLYLNWKMDYLDCNGLTMCQTNSINIGKNDLGIIVSDEYFFNGHKILNPYYDIRVSNTIDNTPVFSKSNSAVEAKKNIFDTELIQTHVLLMKVLGQNNPNLKKPYAILKMSRKSDRVKVKYFAAKLYDGTMVGSRCNSWKLNKNIIAISSGTYMDLCDASIAKPMGLCIDDGNVVNNRIESGYGGLVIVYATGGMVVSAVEKGDLFIKDKLKGNITIDIRNPFQKEQFISWAKEERVSVFQTQLFVYKDSLRLIENPNEHQNPKPRRFLAICKAEDSTIYHYIINIPESKLIYESVTDVRNYLKNVEDVAQIIALLNLDTGCQDFYNVFNSDGSRKFERNFNGDPDLTVNETANLLVYYYE